ncbi:MAG: type IV secretory system conjugative DNA transfer family protein [Acidithiobacillus sp.]
MKLANVVRRCFKRENSGWATEKDIRSLLKTPGNGGVVIGGHAGKPLIYGGDNHVVAVGGPRSGKTAGLVIPTLMNYRGSVVVHDVHGELYKITAEHRRAMGQKVIRFAPGEADNIGFNPLDIVRVGTEHEFADVKWVAEQVCPPENFRDMQAYGLIIPLLLHGINKHGLPSFTLADACQLSQRPEILDELAQNSALKSMLWNFSCAEEKNFVLSIARDHLQDFADAFQDTSFFNLKDLQNGDTPVTLYLVSDDADAKRVTRVHQVLLALIIKAGLSRELVLHQDSWLDDYPCFVPPYKHKLLLLLDDYNLLERGVSVWSDASDAIAFLAAYGIQSFITVQNADQLKALDSIVDNSHIRVFLRPADMKTAEYVSNFLPTVGIKTVHGTWGQRPWMSPDEIMQMTCADETCGIPCITFRAGNAPILGEVVPFWNLGQ